MTGMLLSRMRFFHQCRKPEFTHEPLMRYLVEGLGEVQKRTLGVVLAQRNLTIRATSAALYAFLEKCHGPHNRQRSADQGNGV